MPFAELNDTKLYYEQMGKGVHCMTMHGGLGMDHQHMKVPYKYLEDIFSFTHYDQRANGRSDMSDKDTFTYELLADDTEDLRKHLNLGKIILFGKSAGVVTALKYALKYQDNLSGLILCAGPSVFDQAEFGKAYGDALVRSPERAKVLQDFKFKDEKNPTENERLEQLKLGSFAYYYELKPDFEEIWHKILKDTIFSFPTLNRDGQLRPDYDVRKDLHKIKVPTLVLAGRHDIIPVSNMIDTAERIPNSEMIIFEKSGHFPSLEEPEKFKSSIINWLKKNNSLK